MKTTKNVLIIAYILISTGAFGMQPAPENKPAEPTTALLEPIETTAPASTQPPLAETEMFVVIPHTIMHTVYVADESV